MCWETRQEQMAAWYRDIRSRPDEAARIYHQDYDPLAGALSTLSGRVLDIGGGSGIARHFLPASADYVSVDPSLYWLGPYPDKLVQCFPCLGQRFCCVRAIGERLPFGAGSFDSALAIFSLNHSASPADIFPEVHRVLRANSPFLLVLEEMEPTWADHAALSLRHPRFGARQILRKLISSLPGKSWPLARDHIRIREPEIQQWIDGRFRIGTRSWSGPYLVLMLHRM